MVSPILFIYHRAKHRDLDGQECLALIMPAVPVMLDNEIYLEDKR
jgi:hypothetical protein